MTSQVHFHIRWSTASVLDWESFPTREQAEDSARFLARVGETYTIEERNGNCERCVQPLKRLGRSA